MGKNDQLRKIRVHFELLSRCHEVGVAAAFEDL
jgi:hypothetical protein